jgi:hypothetical protein
MPMCPTRRHFESAAARRADCAGREVDLADAFLTVPRAPRV